MVKSIRSKNVILKLVRSGEKVVPTSDEEQVNLDFANLVIEAEKFVEDYKQKNGTKSFIAERLRDGYIGEIVHCSNGASYIQSVRGKPYGTVVALPTKDGIVIGTSYMDDEDKETGHPIVGLYIALQRALDNLKNNSKFIKSKSRRQVEHFEKRALAFFHPEVYSYSRGTNPVVYENYKEIHERRAKILGK